nr:hypothetical protein [uncultured Cellulosilyticum sp.]
MTFLDEKIAQLERASRQQKREEAAQKLEAAKESQTVKKLTLDEVRSQIKQDTLELDGIKLEFERKKYFEEKLPLRLAKNFFDEVTTDEKAIVFTSNRHCICEMFTYVDENLPIKTIEEYKVEMEENFKKIPAYIGIQKAIALEKLDYLSYRTPSKKGWIYNIILFVHKNERRIMGNLNCLETNEVGCLLLEALVLEMNENM